MLTGLQFPHVVKIDLLPHSKDTEGRKIIGARGREDGLVDLFFPGEQPNLIVGRYIDPPEALSGGRETVLTVEPESVQIFDVYRAPLPVQGKNAR